MVYEKWKKKWKWIQIPLLLYLVLGKYKEKNIKKNDFLIIFIDVMKNKIG